MLPAWKLRARRLYWQGKSIARIASWLGRSRRQVEAALFVRVP
jgi:hypothetical protein